MADQSTTDTPITPVKVSKTIDLSTLNLAPGTYSLKARLNTPGRVSSVSATGINYTVTASYTVTNACSSYASHFTIKVNDTTLATGASAKVVPGDIVTVTSISSPSADLYINGLGIHEDITTLTYSEDITFTTVKDTGYAMMANFTINFQTIKPDYTVSGVWLMNETLTLPTAFEGKVIRAIFCASPDATDSDDEYWDGWTGLNAELGFGFFSSSRPMHYPGLGYVWNESDSSYSLGDVYVSQTATGTTQYKGWRHAGYRKIAFLGDQTLSATAYNWFIANATKQ